MVEVHDTVSFGVGVDPTEKLFTQSGRKVVRLRLRRHRMTAIGLSIVALVIRRTTFRRRWLW